MNKLSKEFRKLSHAENKDLYAELGVIQGGTQVMTVPNRNGYVYARLRSNINEFVQAYNETVTEVYYGTPVVLRREGNRYVVVGLDNQRYAQRATQDTSDGVQRQILAHRHGSSHSFDDQRVAKNGGNDISWIYSRQFMPLLAHPISYTSDSLYLVNGITRNYDGEWTYAGGTGTVGLSQYRHVSGSIFGLLALDTETGNPRIYINSGTYLSAPVTGTSQIIPYLPVVEDRRYLPITAFKIDTGSTSIGWEDLYDARPFYDLAGYIKVDGNNYIQDVEFIGSNVEVTFEQNKANVAISVPDNGLGGNDSSLFHIEGALATGTSVTNLYLITHPTEINAIYIASDVLGVTGSTTIDINLTRSGTTSTIFTTQSNRPVLTYNDTNGWAVAYPDITMFGEGDLLSLDLDTVAYLSENLVVSKAITGTSSTFSGSGLNVRESDGSPSVNNVEQIRIGTGLSLNNVGGNIVEIVSSNLNYYVLLEEQQAVGVDAGTATAGSYAVRTLNTEVKDAAGICTLASNQFVLTAGTYRIRASVPGFACGGHQARLYNATAASEVKKGTTERSGTGDNVPTRSVIVTEFTSNGTDAYQIEQKVQATNAGDGRGIAGGLDTEIYTQVELWKVS